MGISVRMEPARIEERASETRHRLVYVNKVDARSHYDPTLGDILLLTEYVEGMLGNSRWVNLSQPGKMSFAYGSPVAHRIFVSPAGEVTLVETPDE